MININLNWNSSKSQCERILKYLKRGRKLTQLKALRKFNCLRLGARIHDLKSRGHHIESEMITLPNNKRVAQYYLKK